MLDVREEVVTLFTDGTTERAIELATNGHYVMYRLTKVNREERFKYLQDLTNKKLRVETPLKELDIKK